MKIHVKVKIKYNWPLFKSSKTTAYLHTCMDENYQGRYNEVITVVEAEDSGEMVSRQHCVMSEYCTHLYSAYSLNPQLGSSRNPPDHLALAQERSRNCL